MSLQVGELYAALHLDDAKFQAGMQNAQKSLKGVGDKLSSAGGTMTKFVTGPIAAAGAGLMALAKTTADYGDKVAKTSRKVGVSAEAYQELEYALGQTGLAQSDFERAMGRLNQRVGMAAEGNEKYGEALGALGISMAEIESGTLSTDQAMMKALESLSQMTDSQEQAAAAGELFGTKLGRELMPAIQAGAENIQVLRDKAHELGIVMDEESAVASEAFGDSMDDLQRSFGGLAREVGAELIPIFVDKVIPMIQDNIIPLLRGFAERVAGLIKWFGDLPAPVQKMIGIITALAAAVGPVLLVVGKLMTTFSAIAPLVTTLTTTVLPALGPVLTALTGPIGIVVAAIAGLTLAWSIWGDDIKKIVGAAVEWLSRTWDSISDKTIGVWDNISEKIMAVVDAVAEAFSGLGQTVGNVWTAIVSTVRRAINGVIELVNMFIRAMNKVSFSLPNFADNPIVAKLLPDSIKALSGAKIGFNIPEIAKLQQGGILPGFGGGDRIPALLEAGEGVVPAGVVRAGMPAIADWFNSQGVGGGGQAQNVSLTFNAPVYGVDDLRATITDTMEQYRRMQGLKNFGTSAAYGGA